MEIKVIFVENNINDVAAYVWLTNQGNNVNIIMIIIKILDVFAYCNLRIYCVLHKDDDFTFGYN